MQSETRRGKRGERHVNIKGVGEQVRRRKEKRRMGWEGGRRNREHRKKGG